LKVRFKVWLEIDGEPVISEGKYRLLKEIEKTGSIMSAAKNLGLTYKRAHSQIKAIERRLGKRILERKRKKGAELTEDGLSLINKYEKIYEELKKCSERLSSE